MELIEIAYIIVSASIPAGIITRKGTDQEGNYSDSPCRKLLVCNTSSVSPFIHYHYQEARPMREVSSK